MRFVPAGGFRGAVLVVTGFLLAAASLLPAQNATPQRPRITGISHVGYFVSDLPKALSFWHDLLGYDEAYDCAATAASARVAEGHILSESTR